MNPTEFKSLFLQKKQKHKFNAKPCERDGKKFHSKLEAKFYDSLLLLQKSGEVIFFLRQVPFELPGNVQYRADFQIFYASGDVVFVDVKGVDTPVSIIKRKQVEELYPVHIEIVSR